MARNESTGRGSGSSGARRRRGECLRELAGSGDSMASFARRKGVSRRRLEYWRQRLREAMAPELRGGCVAASDAGMH